MAELVYTYLIALSNILIPCIFIRIVGDIFRNYVFDIGGKY